MRERKNDRKRETKNHWVGFAVVTNNTNNGFGSSKIKRETEKESKRNGHVGF